MSDQCRNEGEQLEAHGCELSVKEQMLLMHFRRLSQANQERICRCAEVLSQLPNE